MQDHLKERLTGAAILIAVVVLLVPELFHGRTPANSGAAASAAGPPVRSVTIDLGDVASTRPLTENAPAAAPEATPADTAQMPPAASSTSGTASSKPVANAPASAHATRAAPAAAAAAPNSQAGTAQSGWTVQIGSFARRDYAERMVKDAAAKGFTVEVAGPDDRGLYRVRSTPRTDRAAAFALKQKMQGRGFKPIVNKSR